MTVGAKLFAVVREAAGVAAVTLNLPAGATVADARDELLRLLPALSPHLGRCAYAVNQSYAAPDAPLRDGDELAVIPPVSGG